MTTWDPVRYLQFAGDRARPFLDLVGRVNNDPRLIVDLGCGHGRHSVELAKRGHKVTGIDLTEGFLEVARRDAEEQKVDVSFVRGDIGAFESEAEARSWLTSTESMPAATAKA